MSFAGYATVVGNAVLVGLSTGAGWLDLRQGRIPNRLTYAGILVGLALAALTPALPVRQSALGIALAFVALILFWNWGMLGGGDVKLSMMVGALKGPWFLVHFLFYVFSLCLVMVLFLAILRVGVVRALGFLLRNIVSLILFRPLPKTPDELEGVRISFGLISLLAVVVCLLMDWWGYLDGPPV